MAKAILSLNQKASMKYAIIDVGSNSIRLMVIANGEPLFSDTATTRLGQSLAVNNTLGAEEFQNSIDAIKNFCNRAILAGVDNIKIFATEAVRAAKNGKIFEFSVFANTSERLHVLTGDEEAKIAYMGATTSKQPSLVIDIGGGSSEIAIGDNGAVTYSKSYPIGAVRSFSRSCDELTAVDSDLDNIFTDIVPVEQEKQCFCVGGTCTTVAMLLIGGDIYDATKTHGYVIEQEKLRVLSDNLFTMGNTGRSKLLAVSVARRDIIANGTRILLKLMDKLQLDSITASEDDNLIGYYRVFLNEK